MDSPIQIPSYMPYDCEIETLFFPIVISCFSLLVPSMMNDLSHLNQPL